MLLIIRTFGFSDVTGSAFPFCRNSRFALPNGLFCNMREALRCLGMASSASSG